MFQAIPATSNCRAIFDRRGHLLLGISPFNSRFSDEYVAELVDWARFTAQDFDVLLSGDEAGYLLEAIGTPAGRARTRARRAVGRNRRAVEAALGRSGIVDRNRIHTFNDFQQDHLYLRMREEVTRVYSTHEGFRRACLDMSRQAIAGRLRTVRNCDQPVSDDQAAVAVEYVLAELPFFVGAAEMLGVPESLMVYHRPWELGERIFSGEVPVKMRDNQGYLTLVES